MMDGFLSFAKRRLFDTILLVSAAFAFVLACYGWWNVYPELDPKQGLQSQLSYTFHQALRAFVISDVYAEYDGDNFTAEIELSGLIGSLVAISAIIKTILMVFVKPIERLRAGLRRGHVVVIGDREIAFNIAEDMENGRAVTYHGESERMRLSPVLSVDRPQSLQSTFFRQSLDNAERVIIAEKTDGETAETALSLSRHTNHSIIFAVLDNPWIASQLRQTSLADLGGEIVEDQLIAVSETRALARTAVLPAPPFLLAQEAKQKRIHVLFYGFSPLTIAMIEEILLSNLVPDLRMPRFTVLTDQAFAAEAEFKARHPGLVAETRRSDLGMLDVRFIECAPNGVSEGALIELKSIIRDDPVTIAYVTREDSLEPFSAALALQLAARQQDLFECPIFVQSRQGNGMKSVAWNKGFTPRGLYAFGGWHSLSMALGILDKEPDRLAKAYHENYRRVVWNDTDEKGRWEVLAEAFRMANRNAILHLPAKLASLGFDISPYLTQEDVLSPNTAPCVKPGVEIVPDEKARERLAHLEHERWMMERWVSGWRFAETRDNTRLRHTDLIPYAQLSDQKKGYDRAFVDWLASWIDQDANNGVVRSK